MKKFEYGFLSALLVMTVIFCAVFGASMTVSAANTVLYQSDYEEEGAKSVIRAENGDSSIVGDLPGGRDGHATQLLIEKNLIGVHPKNLGGELYKYGYFQEGDTFHFALDLYFDTDKAVNVYPFVLLCIFGEDYNKKVNYDEWYPSVGKGTLKQNEGTSVVQGRTWTRLDYTYTVKNGCSDKGRDISFWKDGGCFYIATDITAGSMMPIYVDNVIIEVDTENEPTRTTTTTTTTRVTFEPTTTTAAASEEPSNASSEPEVQGDVNGDGSLDMKDVLMVRKFIAGMDSSIDEAAADLNRDGSVDMKDVLMMRKIIAGLLQQL